jgi:hypothetical protein
MAAAWRSLADSAVRIALREGPRLLRQVRRSRDTASPAGRTRVRTEPPQTRQLTYAPDLDGAADPGEIVWTWVPYEEDAAQGKDRPVLVVGREAGGLIGLMLSSNQTRDDENGWLRLGTGPWDGEGRASWVRLDRVLEIDEDGIRREGAVLDRARFDQVADRLRRDHGWR